MTEKLLAEIERLQAENERLARQVRTLRKALTQIAASTACAIDATDAHRYAANMARAALSAFEPAAAAGGGGA